MNGVIRDIHLAEYDVWKNLLQSGYWISLALLVVAGLIIWKLATGRNKWLNKRHLLKQLAGVDSIDVSEANALLYNFFRREGKMPQSILARDREQWRKTLIAHNTKMPQLAQLLAYHYRDDNKLDGTWLLIQLRQYIKQIR